MKNNFSRIGLATLCGWFGITRQAYYQNTWKGIDTSIEDEIILKEVLNIRKYHQRMGTRKLYEKLQPFMLEHQIKMGRVIKLLACKKTKKKSMYYSIFSLVKKISKLD